METLNIDAAIIQGRGHTALFVKLLCVRVNW